MFETNIEILRTDHSTRYRLLHEQAPLPFEEVIERWVADADFRAFFSGLLADSSFSGFRWETPALSNATKHNPFEFVLLSAPGFCARATDSETYANYFTSDNDTHGIVSFSNLRGDATLIVPSPRTGMESYGHLAAFVREAPATQVDALWKAVGETVAG